MMQVFDSSRRGIREKRGFIKRKDGLKLRVAIISTFALFFIAIASLQLGRMKELTVTIAVREDEDQNINVDAKTTAEEEVDVKNEVQSTFATDKQEGNTETLGKNCKVESVGFVKRAPDDAHVLGRCRHEYPNRAPPPKGYLKDIDYFFKRYPQHDEREQCFLHCIQNWLDNANDEIHNDWLVDAASMGLVQVVKYLISQYPQLNSTQPAEFRNKPNLNAIQEAIRGGYAEIVKVLCNSNIDKVIDEFGRTVADYVRMKGCAIRPHDAKTFLNLDIQTETPNLRQKQPYIEDSGWSYDKDYVPSSICDVDVIYGDMSRETFYKDYFVPSRAFVLRGHVPERETRAFDKSRWRKTERFHPSTKVPVGPTAYPHLTGQQKCSTRMSIAQMEALKECEEQPGVPMVHARHPTDEDLQELYPMYNGDLYNETGAWSVMPTWFGPKPWIFNPSWQVFFGGDDSGATLHWHYAALNVLYTGVKEWAITPPLHRGMTGMQARDASQSLDESITLRCTQLPGDLMYIPNYWGHLTLNHGFSIGAAVILPPKYQAHASVLPNNESSNNARMERKRKTHARAAAQRRREQEAVGR